MAKFGIEANTAGLDNLNVGIVGVVGQLKQLAIVVGAGLAVRRLVGFTLQMSKVADELDGASKRLGISTDALQSWRHAALLANVEAGELDGAFRILQRNLATNEKPFRALGVSVRDSRGELREVDDILPEIADRFQLIKSPAQRTAIAMQLFGRAGQKLVPLLENGSAGIAEMRQAFKDLGGGMDEVTVKAGAELDDQLTNLNAATLSLQSRLAGWLFPAFIKIVELTTKVAAGFKDLIENTKILQAVLVVLTLLTAQFGLVFAVSFLLPTLIALAFTAVIVALGLAVEDLLVFLDGGESVIGDFVDAMFGVGSAQIIAEKLRDTWDDLVEKIKQATRAVGAFFGRNQTPEEVANEAAQHERENLAAAKRRLGQARVAARGGGAVRFEGETRAQSQERYRRLRAEGIANGSINADRTDVRQGLARRVSSAPSQRLTQVATGAGGRGRGGVVNNSTVNVNLPAGMSADQAREVQRVLERHLAQRDRQTDAHLAEESIGE